MTKSQRLLAEYAQSGSEAAFREIVTRYLDLTYSTAIRLVDGDAHLAQDVTQLVFIDLARMACTLSREVMLGGWLHRHCCFVARKVMRGECRRAARERQTFRNASKQTQKCRHALLGGFQGVSQGWLVLHKFCDEEIVSLLVNFADGLGE